MIIEKRHSVYPYLDEVRTMREAAMEISKPLIDAGAKFDFGRTSEVYAKFRDIYPACMYERLSELGIGIAGQQVLDLGTGTGVLPRGMVRFGARWTGTDISENQIAQARRLSEGKSIEYLVCSAEEMDFAEIGRASCRERVLPTV